MADMPKLTNDQVPIVAAALIRLRGDTLSAIAAATDIRAANLSVWLRGKAQVISAKRVAGLLYHLGIEGGQLRSDILHQWQDSGLLSDTRTVLDALLTNEGTKWLFQDLQPALTKTRFMQVNDAWLRLEITASATVAADLGQAIHAHRVLTFRTPLSDVPTDSLSSARDALLAMAEQMAVDVGDQELLEGLMARLADLSAGDLVFNTVSASEWARLEGALSRALRLGVSPSAIAKLIDDGAKGAHLSDATH
ncbi:hypothetical protein [Aquabacterium sp.]|uniref:hypothetical protein n=1 Tax=Aquabacterium sp. TaxID=1872578 RepID=UPI0025B85063|nr:hypothetical protein [Aquabacterium sp.]